MTKSVSAKGNVPRPGRFRLLRRLQTYFYPIYHRKHKTIKFVPDSDMLESRFLLTLSQYISLFGQGTTRYSDGVGFAKTDDQRDVITPLSVSFSSSDSTKSSISSATASYSVSLTSTISPPNNGIQSGSFLVSAAGSYKSDIAQSDFADARYSSEWALSFTAAATGDFRLDFDLATNANPSLLPALHHLFWQTLGFASTGTEIAHDTAKGVYVIHLVSGTQYYIGYKLDVSPVIDVYETESSLHTYSSSASIHWQMEETPSVTSNLNLNSLELVDGQTIDAAYSVFGSDLPSAGTIDFYWASGPNRTDSIGNPYKVAAQRSSGNYTASVPLTALSPRPSNATCVVAVAESSYADPNHDVASVAIPLSSIRLTNASLSPDESTIKAGYAIAGSQLNSSASLNFVWASGPDKSDIIGRPFKVSTQTGIGDYTTSVPLTALGSRPANASYILVVADSTNAETTHRLVAIAFPTLTPTDLSRATDPEQGPGISFSYNVSGELPKNTVIQFYWATDPDFAHILDKPVAYSYAVNTPDLESEGSHGPVFLPRSAFAGVNDSSILDEAKYLLMVTSNSDGSHTTLPMLLTIPITLDQVHAIIPPPPAPKAPKPFTLTKPSPPTAPISHPSPDQERQYQRELLAYRKATARYNRLKAIHELAVARYERRLANYSKSKRVLNYSALSNALVTMLNSEENLSTFQITTFRRKAAFIGQVAEETGNLVYPGERPNPADKNSTSKYHGRGLLMLTDSLAAERRNPKDFPHNYTAFGNYIANTDSNPGFKALLLKNPDLIVTNSALGARSGGWYWYANDINAIADNLVNGNDLSTILKISKAVNTGNSNSSTEPNGEETREDDTELAFNKLSDFW